MRVKLKDGASAEVEENVRIGKALIPLSTAKIWVRDYTNPANDVSRNPYAYPAYDRYEESSNRSSVLTDADFLAPGLLNVPVKVRSYYALQRIKPKLEAALRDDNLGMPLADLECDDRIAEMVKALYCVLDHPAEKPWGVNGTTLSKVLHRKRPHSLVLHDRWVRECYVGGKGPVEKRKSRSWADYMVEITLAIREDLRSQSGQFQELDKASSCPGQLSHVRLLDIVAWKSKGKAQD